MTRARWTLDGSRIRSVCGCWTSCDGDQTRVQTASHGLFISSPLSHLVLRAPSRNLTPIPCPISNAAALGHPANLDHKPSPAPNPPCQSPDSPPGQQEKPETHVSSCMSPPAPFPSWDRQVGEKRLFDRPNSLYHVPPVRPCHYHLHYCQAPLAPIQYSSYFYFHKTRLCLSCPLSAAN